jgi:hypothetical protein
MMLANHSSMEKLQQTDAYSYPHKINWGNEYDGIKSTYKQRIVKQELKNYLHD